MSIARHRVTPPPTDSQLELGGGAQMNIVQPGLLVHNRNHYRKKAEAAELLRVGVSNQDGQDPIWEMLSLKPWDEWLRCLFNTSERTWPLGSPASLSS